MSKNNINWLINKAGYQKQEFGELLFPELPSKTTNQKSNIRSRVNRLCKDDANIQVELLPKIAELLNCDYNEMFNYSKKEN